MAEYKMNVVEKTFPDHKSLSTYIAVVVWGIIGFGFQPTIGSFVVHFVVAPLALLLLTWRARYEGAWGQTSGTH